MTYGEAGLYGLIQGATEFLPVSSSAHLALAPWLLRRPDPGLTFDVALHMGTLAAVAAYFGRDWARLLSGACRQPRGPEARLLGLIVLASVPAAIAGLALEKQAESAFRDPVRIALTLIAFGALLFWADLKSRKSEGEASLGFGSALAIGAAQALAIVPGVSRSGVTMTAALALGLTREAAARFSFLLATPIIAGAGLLKLRHLHGADVTGPFLFGVLVSAVTGVAAVKLLFSRLSRGMGPYAVYRAGLGAAVLILAARGWR